MTDSKPLDVGQTFVAHTGLILVASQDLELGDPVGKHYLHVGSNAHSPHVAPAASAQVPLTGLRDVTQTLDRGAARSIRTTVHSSHVEGGLVIG